MSCRCFHVDVKDLLNVISEMPRNFHFSCIRVFIIMMTTILTIIIIYCMYTISFKSLELVRYFERSLYSKNSNIVKYKQSSVSHDPSEIILICWFAAQVWSIIIGSQLLIVVLIIISVNRGWTAFIWNACFVTYMSVTFDQINASILNVFLLSFFFSYVTFLLPQTFEW